MPDQDDRLSAELQDYYARMAQQSAPDVTGRVMMTIETRTARRRTFAAIAGGVLAAAAAAAVIVLALANHNSPTGVAPAHSPTPAPTVAPTGSPTSQPTPTAAPVVAGPTVHGFVPTDVTAVSANQWWVLGYNGPSCSSASCTRILHTTDGGHTFASVPLPPVAPARNGEQADRLRFADPLDGWLVSGAGAVWATHDGGIHWARDSVGSVTDLEASGGYADAIVCATTSTCTLERSPVSEDSWALLSASAGHGVLGRLNVNGVHVWAAIWSPGGGPGTLLASTDGGLHFSTQTACSSALGFANVYAVSGSVLWATCATGTEASAYRSVDGGQHFTQLAGPVMLPNFAAIAGVSSTTAVIGAVGLQRTVDGGQTVTTVESSQAQWTVVGFTTSVNGFAFEAQSSRGAALWRTNDAGAHWYHVLFP